MSLSFSFGGIAGHSSEWRVIERRSGLSSGLAGTTDGLVVAGDFAGAFLRAAGFAMESAAAASVR